MHNGLSFESLVNTVVRHWRLFLGTAALAAVASIVFSGPTFITPRFRSSAIVYPVNLASYSIEPTSDQLLQLLESNSIRDSLIRMHRLVEHYDVDTTVPPGRFYLEAEYRDHVSISKTSLESVQIEIEDEDPATAQAMVSDLLDQANKLARRLRREKSEEVLRITQREMDLARHKLDSVEARLDTLRARTGLLDYHAQTDEVTRGYMRLLSNGSPSARTEARQLLEALGTHGGEFLTLTELARNYRDQFVQKQLAHERVLTDLDKVLTYTDVLVYPERADKKVYPVRWAIVVASTVSACLLCLVLVMLRERPEPF